MSLKFSKWELLIIRVSFAVFNWCSLEKLLYLCIVIICWIILMLIFLTKNNLWSNIPFMDISTAWEVYHLHCTQHSLIRASDFWSCKYALAPKMFQEAMSYLILLISFITAIRKNLPLSIYLVKIGQRYCQMIIATRLPLTNCASQYLV